MKNSKKILGLVLLSIFILQVSGCTDSSAKEETKKGEVTKVRVAHSQNYVPYDFVNEKGESDGFEVQVLKEVDALLDDYSFEYTGTSDEDLLIGLETKKYDIGVKGAWYTEERAEKFVLPQKRIGASTIGITYRSENKDDFNDLASFAKFSGKLVPISPQNAQWSIVEEFNKNNPDNKIDLVASESFNISDAYSWVLEGRYDAYFDIKLSYNNSVVAEDGPYHNLADKLAYLPYEAIPTYPIFSKDNQDLADKYDEAIKTLEDNGTIAKLSEKYFGEDIFQYIKE